MNNIVAVKVGYNLGTITNNLDEVSASVKAYCDDFKGVVVTEDTVADGRQMLANIRKEKKYLDDQRKEIKKAWNAPYQEFEKKVKEVTALYDEPIALINGQIQELEEQRKAQKRETIQNIWDSTKIPEEIAGWIRLEEIYNPKWENATFKESAVESEIADHIASLKMAFDTVKLLNHPYEEEGMKVLKETKDLQSAMTRMTRLLEQEKIIEMKRQEAERKAQELREAKTEEPQEAPKAVESVQTVSEPPQEAPVINFEDFVVPEDKTYEVIVNVEQDRLMDLRVYLDGLGYFYTVKEV